MAFLGFLARPRATDQGAHRLLFDMDHVSYRYGDGSIGLSDVSVRIGERRVAVIGLNGSGKTTLLRVLDGSLTPSEGSVRIGRGRELLDPARRADSRRIGKLVGRIRGDDPAAALPAGSSVGQILRKEARSHGSPASRSPTFVGDLLSRFSLSGAVDLPVSALDGEQRHMLAMARASAHSPSCVIADEPTAGLDEVGSAHVASTLFSEASQIVFSSHDLSMVADPGHGVERVLVLDHGAVVCDDSPRNATRFYADLIRSAYAAARRCESAERRHR